MVFLRVADAITGTWEQTFTVPGNSLMVTLATSGNAISGTGTWSGEACCGGIVTIMGTVTGAAVSLRVTSVTTIGFIVPPRTSQFTGMLLDRNTIAGTYSDTPGYEIVLHRTN